MNASARARFLAAVSTDTKATRGGRGWVVPCLHCRRKLTVGADGSPGLGASLEHIVPQSWFGLRDAAELTGVMADANDPRNLAIACASCNQQKGTRHDARGPGHADAVTLVKQLLETRWKRYSASGSSATAGEVSAPASTGGKPLG